MQTYSTTPLPYLILSKEALSMPARKCSIIGTLLVREDDLLLKGIDGVEVPVETVSLGDATLLADKENELVLVLGFIEEGRVIVSGWARLSNPINLELFQRTLKQMQKYPDIFSLGG